MKVRVIKKITIEGRDYLPSPEILDIWPSVAKKGIISGQLEDVEGNFLAAWNARQSYKAKQETRKGK